MAMSRLRATWEFQDFAGKAGLSPSVYERRICGLHRDNGRLPRTSKGVIDRKLIAGRVTGFRPGLEPMTATSSVTHGPNVRLQPTVWCGFSVILHNGRLFSSCASYTRTRGCTSSELDVWSSADAHRSLYCRQPGPCVRPSFAEGSCRPEARPCVSSQEPGAPVAFEQEVTARPMTTEGTSKEVAELHKQVLV